MAACLDYLGPVDRKAIARTERRRQALEALEFERARAAALQERLEAIVAELDGPALDAAIFARLAPEDVEIVRAALQNDETEPAEALDGSEFTTCSRLPLETRRSLPRYDDLPKRSGVAPGEKVSGELNVRPETTRSAATCSGPADKATDAP